MSDAGERGERCMRWARRYMVVPVLLWPGPAAVRLGCGAGARHMLACACQNATPALAGRRVWTGQRGGTWRCCTRCTPVRAQQPAVRMLPACAHALPAESAAPQQCTFPSQHACIHACMPTRVFRLMLPHAPRTHTRTHATNRRRNWLGRLFIEDSGVGFAGFQWARGSPAAAAAPVPDSAPQYRFLQPSAPDSFLHIRLDGMGPKLLVSDVSTAEQAVLRWRMAVRGNTAVEFGVVPLCLAVSARRRSLLVWPRACAARRSRGGSPAQRNRWSHAAQPLTQGVSRTLPLMMRVRRRTTRRCTSVCRRSTSLSGCAGRCPRSSGPRASRPPSPSAACCPLRHPS